MNSKSITCHKTVIDEATSPSVKTFWWEIFFLLVAPFIIYLILKPNLVNQAVGIDANLYAGYVHNFKDLIDRYGLTYYSVRFAAIWPHRLLTFLFEPWTAYLVSRYLLSLLAAAPLYLLIKQHFSRIPAILAYIFLLSNPIFERALLWTYIDSFGIVYTLAAICLLFFKTQNWRIIAIAGILMGLAIHSTLYCSAVLIAVLPGYIYYIYPRGLKQQLKALFLLGSGIVTVTVIGCSIFAIKYGSWNIFEPTTKIMSETIGASVWFNKEEGWQLRALPLYLPTIPLLSVFLRNKQQSLSRLTVAVMLFLMLFSILIYDHGLFKPTAILDYHYYFSFFIIPITLVTAALFGEFLQSASKKMALISLASTSCICLVLPVFFARAVMPVLTRFQMSACYGNACIPPMTVFAALTVLFFIGLWLSATKMRAATSPIIMTASLLLLISPMSVYRSMFTAQYPNEEATYKTTTAFSQAFPPLSQGGTKLWFWYENNRYSHLTAAQSAFLWGYSRLEGTSANSEGMPQLTAECLKKLKEPDCNTVVLLGRSTEQIKKGMSALTEAGISYQEKSSRVIESQVTPVYITCIEIAPNNADRSKSNTSN